MTIYMEKKKKKSLHVTIPATTKRKVEEEKSPKRHSSLLVIKVWKLGRLGPLQVILFHPICI
jgi:hypothetical protein